MALTAVQTDSLVEQHGLVIVQPGSCARLAALASKLEGGLERTIRALQRMGHAEEASARARKTGQENLLAQRS